MWKAVFVIVYPLTA